MKVSNEFNVSFGNEVNEEKFQEIVKSILMELEWLENIENGDTQCHIATGNCEKGEYHKEKHFVPGTNFLSGSYQNAAAVCPHCFPGSARAELTWVYSEPGVSYSEKSIKLETEGLSTKPSRIRDILNEIRY